LKKAIEGDSPGGQMSWGSTNTLLSFRLESRLLSRNLDQNMHENALFLENTGKIATALGAPPPPTPRWPPAAGGSALLSGAR